MTKNTSPSVSEILWSIENYRVQGYRVTDKLIREKTHLIEALVLQTVMEVMATPKEHIADELCCDECDYRNKFRSNLQEALGRVFV